MRNAEQKQDFFQDFMPNNICFGCGSQNPEGLQIKSYWEGDEGVCLFSSEPKYRGWENIMNGGILATLIDCHCMGTALAHAYREENRPMASDPVYRYATASITVRYLKPTPNDQTIMLRARVFEAEGRKSKVACEVIADGVTTATAEVLGIRVVEGTPGADSPFQ
jgi:acyl-coenzyme A thioesterase PaaI-like protein